MGDLRGVRAEPSFGGIQGLAGEEALGSPVSFLWAEASGQPTLPPGAPLAPQLSAQMHACSAFNSRPPLASTPPLPPQGTEGDRTWEEVSNPQRRPWWCLLGGGKLSSSCPLLTVKKPSGLGLPRSLTQGGPTPCGRPALRLKRGLCRLTHKESQVPQGSQPAAPSSKTMPGAARDLLLLSPRKDLFTPIDQEKHSSELEKSNSWSVAGCK